MFERCAAEGREILVTVVGQLTSSHLVRGWVVKPRVKSLSSIEKKATREAWSEDEVFERLTDAVGFRVVCNNTEDSYRIVDAVRASTRFELVTLQDFVEHPQDSGYRAVHMDVIYEVPKIGKVPCEIQIRTLAQDTWALLAHHDLFKNRQNVPAYLLKSSKRLAALLALADELAQDIREDVSKPLVGVESTDDSLTPQSLAFVYERAFGHPAPEYVIEMALGECVESGCHRLDLLERTLMTDEFREAIGQTYKRAAKWDMDEETWFSLAIHVAVSDVGTATEIAEARGKRERAEIEAIARREMAYHLPDTLDEFKDIFMMDRHGMVDPGEGYEAANQFDALTNCDLCEAPIVEVESLVEGILRHYGAEEDDDGELGSLIADSGIEIGDWDQSGLCSYHAYVMSKDD